MYTQDHEETFPSSATVWNDIKVDAGVLVCPTKGKGTPIGYGYPEWRSGQALGELPNPTNRLLCADFPQSTAILAGNSIYNQNEVALRHSGHAVCAFVDGHVGDELQINEVFAKYDFETGASADWNYANMNNPAITGRNYLGKFYNENVLLTLKGLPQHCRLQMEFDVYVMSSWDGNSLSTNNGPDVFSLGIVGNTTPMLYTTFGISQGPQAYPGTFVAEGDPGNASNPTRTGASEPNNSLGTGNDNVYHIVKTGLHTGGTAQIYFKGEHLSDEYYGIDNVVVSAL
jgi:prepilin-type processing-associated H-X9-DG protein